MTRREFPLERNGPSRVEIRWQSLDEVRVLVDGNLVHTFFGGASFERGAAVPLPDGSTLGVRLRRWAGIDVRRNEVPLPGSVSDSLFALGNAAKMMFILGGLGLVINVPRYRSEAAGDLRAILGLYILGDLLFLTLGILAKRGARWAVVIAMIMVLGSAGISFQLGGARLKTILDLLIFAMFWRYLSISSGAPLPIVAEPIQSVTPRGRKPNATGWPTRDDDEPR